MPSLLSGVTAVDDAVGSLHQFLDGSKLLLDAFIVDEVITMGVEYGIVEKSGSWYSYNGEKIGQGMNAARKFMEANPDIDEEITEKIKAAMFAAEE